MKPSVHFSVIYLLSAFLILAQLGFAHPWTSSAYYPKNCSINEHPDVVRSSHLIRELVWLTAAPRRISTASTTFATFIVHVFPQETTIATCITALTTHQSHLFSFYTVSPLLHTTGVANSTISPPVDMASWPLTSSATAGVKNLAMSRHTR